MPPLGDKMSQGGSVQPDEKAGEDSGQQAYLRGFLHQWLAVQQGPTLREARESKQNTEDKRKRLEAQR